MKHRLIVFFIVIIITIVTIFLFLRFYEYKNRQEQIISDYSLSKQEISMLYDGDIILRHGYGFVSDMIVKTLNDKTDLSHCAILTQKKGIWIVVHSVSSTLSDIDGVQWQPLNTFIKQSKKNTIVVLRYKHVNKDSILTKIGNRAKYYLAQKVPFDNAFSLYDSSSFYCSELIWKVFKDEFKVDIFESKYSEGRYDYMKFDTFFDTTYFKVIIDHRNRKNKICYRK